MSDDSVRVTCLGIREDYGWVSVGYDIQYRYGYETMLRLFDKLIADYSVKVDRIAKAKLAGMSHTVVWRNWLFNKAPALSDMDALKEECGQVAVGGVSKKLNDLQLYITLTNQTSIITIQVPQEKYSEDVKRELDIAARSIQEIILSLHYEETSHPRPFRADGHGCPGTES